MKSYTVVLSGKEYEILQDTDGKFIKPDFVKELEAYGTDVKPAHEPICVARKPIEGNVANNVLKHGCGGLNIDGCRVKTSDSLDGGGTIDKSDYETVTLPSQPVRGRSGAGTGGRFPANLIHSGEPEVVGLFPEDKSGSASRFFYCAKSSKSERNAGLEGFEEKRPDSRTKTGMGTFDEKGVAKQQNHHPTVKPLSLTKYLANLIKPPTGGRLLVPFSGSGSEMIGALQAGWEYVEGVELTEEYIPIAEARIKYWIERTVKEQISLL